MFLEHDVGVMIKIHDYLLLSLFLLTLSYTNHQALSCQNLFHEHQYYRRGFCCGSVQL